MSRKLGTFGVIFTVLYLAAWGVLVALRSDKFAGMELNAIGDFLGGSFGPLAFLWLVLGFFQQGIELRQNSEALKLQVMELKESVEQQKNMVDVARMEHQATLQALSIERDRQEAARRTERAMNQPIVTFTATSRAGEPSRQIQQTLVRNIGNTAKKLQFEYLGRDATFDPAYLEVLEAGAKHQLGFHYGPGVNDGEVVVRYVDRVGEPGVLRYQCITDVNGFVQFTLIAETDAP